MRIFLWLAAIFICFILHADHLAKPAAGAPEFSRLQQSKILKDGPASFALGSVDSHWLPLGLPPTFEFATPENSPAPRLFTPSFIAVRERRVFSGLSPPQAA